MTDIQLLDDFIHRKDGASFDALVTRHGPRVIRVCREVLTEPDDIEDAYQATFLVLVQKAPAIRDPGALGNWLHGVAHRVSLRLRRDQARRRKHEGLRARMAPAPGDGPRPWDDLGKTVREELDTLPEAYRIPLELCYLRGQSHEQAATALGWPLGTLKTRILRGRRRLQDLLDRRGISVGVGLLWLLWPGREAAQSATAGPVDEPSLPPPPGPKSGVAREAGSPSRPSPWATRLGAPVSLALAQPLWAILVGLVAVLIITQLLGFFAQTDPTCT
ncbi:RNA polymerase sigma factor [Tundrisphaera sp. TA3]|uniref:RNA polymerase sigma factor n=1 Tax=Tundrisphaera sp. TA3 TaxID=3435775 RepID=UPI003EBDD497